MKKSVLITGASSGIGRATAFYFHQKGWQVIATMRSPERETELNQLDGVLCVALDVTKPASIASAISAGVEKFGRLDAVINNAGYGLSGVFEAITPEQIRRQFDTNVFGLMDVCRAVLPQLRKQRAGVLINVASMGGRLTFPLYSIYHASKWAVEGFTESLHYELAPLGIRVKIIEPGAIKTDFGSRSADFAGTGDRPELGDYTNWVQNVLANTSKAADQGATAEVVAAAIFKAATDGATRLRYTVGLDANGLLWVRRFFGEGAFFGIVRSLLTKRK